MLRQSFERDLQRLQDQVSVLGSMVQKALLDSVEYLEARDLEASRRLIDDDRYINEKRFEIEADILAVIATQQPMARDLRILAAMLEIITELERIGDYGKGIAKINLMIGENELLKPLVDIPRMADKALDMLRRALDAFMRRDAEAAKAIPKEDDEVDALYNQVNRELMTFIISDPRTIEQANYLLWAAHNLERAADRVTNICERVVFMVTGTMAELDTHFDN
ncbi:MAG TPA: phosphate signaling complex protein PhoU [Chloroflexi bacterium]|jgi:phosphate transport system protein|nr:phosphate signaling complex protein PhoU [Chloroflexota bacterium]